MTQEQKAKAYDEALERMKSWVRGEHPECFTEAQKAAEFIFPELKEPKDKKIIRAIKIMYSLLPNKPKYIGEVEVKDIFNWLEKQCGHNANIQRKDFAPIY